MKCLYYLAPNLDAAQDISADIERVGIQEWFVHVVARDKAGLQRERLHSSNYFETTNVLRDGLIGIGLGFVSALLALVLALWFEPFGPEAPKLLYGFIFVVITLFGAWVGGLTGLDSENRKIRRFREDIDAGACLVLIYSFKEQEPAVRKMMKERHPDVKLAAVDRHFLNPFSRLRRRRPRATAEQT